MYKIKTAMRVFSASLLAVIFSIASSLSFVSPVSAAEEELPEYRLAITPSQASYETLEPGKSYVGSFTIRNSGKQDFNYSVTFAPYSIVDQNYNADYEKDTIYTELSKWIEVDKDEGFLTSGQETLLNYRITVPSDAHGGAQAASIMVTMEETSEEDSNAVQTLRQLGFIVFGNVNGEIKKSGSILENKIASIRFNPPITATSIVENTGNVYTRAQYILQVFPLFGDEEVYTNEDHPETNVIFPETTRYAEISWDDAPHLGIFRVRQTIKIFDTESVEEKIVFLCPIWFLIAVIAFIFLIIFWIVSRVRGRNRE